MLNIIFEQPYHVEECEHAKAAAACLVDPVLVIGTNTNLESKNNNNSSFTTDDTSVSTSRDNKSKINKQVSRVLVIALHITILGLS